MLAESCAGGGAALADFPGQCAQAQGTGLGMGVWLLSLRSSRRVRTAGVHAKEEDIRLQNP